MEHIHRFHQMSRQNRRCKMDYIPGMIIMAGWNYVPTNWLLCDGSVYPANSYQSLFNVIGNSYGGNSGKSFAVPNLSYRMPLGAGPMPASSIVFSLGQQGGAAARTLTPANISNHIHINTACQFTPPTISAQCGNAQLYLPYTHCHQFSRIATSSCV